MCTGFWWGNLRKESLGDPGIEGRIILRCIFKNYDVGYGLDGDRWRALVSVVMNLRVL
jgi:hypothetical protein